MEKKNHHRTAPGIEPSILGYLPNVYHNTLAASDPQVCASSGVPELSIGGVVDGPSVKRLKDEQRLGLYRPDAKAERGLNKHSKKRPERRLAFKLYQLLP